MSIRTIVEIDHDYIFDIEEDVDLIAKLAAYLKSGRKWEDGEIPGIRFLWQRHHSEKVKLTVE